jgi:hypothetical protein
VARRKCKKSDQKLESSCTTLQNGVYKDEKCFHGRLGGKGTLRKNERSNEVIVKSSRILIKLLVSINAMPLEVPCSETLHLRGSGHLL